jgi:bifunctional non-homologous end joining protein LigD
MEKSGKNGLKEYELKRNFTQTSEPRPLVEKIQRSIFVVQEHRARRLHYDLRLERDGVLKSWAVPKAPPLEFGEKRLAVQTEDHPAEYARFEGTIPDGEYGAGTVKTWDKGSYEPIIWSEDKIEVIFQGERLKGRYILVRFKRAGEKDWLLFKVTVKR